MFFDDLCDVGDGVIGVDFCDDDVDFVVGVMLDFFGGCDVMDGWVCWVFELLGYEVVLIGFG